MVWLVSSNSRRGGGASLDQKLSRWNREMPSGAQPQPICFLLGIKNSWQRKTHENESSRAVALAGKLPSAATFSPFAPFIISSLTRRSEER